LAAAATRARRQREHHVDQQRVQNALNSVIFRPVDGLVMDRLPAQEVCAQARYWPVQNPGRTATIDWCFRVDG